MEYEMHFASKKLALLQQIGASFSGHTRNNYEIVILSNFHFLNIGYYTPF